MINIPGTIKLCLWMCCVILATAIISSKSDLPVGIVIKECEAGLYRNHSVTGTIDSFVIRTHENTTNQYFINQKVNELRSEEPNVLILRIDPDGNTKSIELGSPNIDRSLTNINELKLYIYLCDMTCSGDYTKEYFGICEDFKTVSRMSVSVIKHLRWTTVVIIYDNTTAMLLKRLYNSLVEPNVFVLSYNLDLIVKKNDTSTFLQEIYMKLYEDGINVTVVCGVGCIKNILKEADKFDTLTNNFRRTAMKQRSCWLLVTDCSLEGDIVDFVNNLLHLDNVVLLNLNIPPVEAEYIMQKTYNAVISMAVDIFNRNTNKTKNDTVEVRDLKMNYTSFWSNISFPLYTLLWRSNGRSFSTVGHVSYFDELSVSSDLFPNLNYGFNGQRLTVTTNPWPPFVDTKIENGTLTYFGFCMDLLGEFANKLNFTYSLVTPADGEWGKLQEDGTWTGVIGQLQMRTVDLMVAPATILALRETSMDFTYPFYFDTSNFLIKKPDPDKDKWRVFIDPFHWHVYVGIAVALPICALVLYLVEKYNPFFKRCKESPHNYQYGFWYMFGALLTQGGERTPQTQSARSLISAWWIFSIVILATYSGNLIAFLTVNKEKLPITTLDELGSQSAYKWGTIGGSAFISLFELSALPSFRKIWNGLKEMNKTDPDVLHPDPDVHIQKVRTENYVYIGDKISMKTRVSNDCDLVISLEEYPDMNYGVGLPNNSPYTESFSHVIMELMESGIFQIWWNKHWPIKTFCKGELTAEAKKITIIDVQSAFYLISIGIVTSFIVLLIEMTIERCKERTTVGNVKLGEK